MIKITTKNTSEREQEFQEKYKKFKKLAYTTNMKRPELLKELDISQHNRIYKRIQQKWDKEEPVTLQKRGTLINFNKWNEFKQNEK